LATAIRNSQVAFAKDMAMANQEAPKSKTDKLAQALNLQLKPPAVIPNDKKVVVATVAPPGGVIPAREVVRATVVEENNNDFLAILENYLRHKSHTKTSNVWDYVKKQYSAGLKFNESTKRWIKR
jgi:hypothetical protein